jgi:hypothetical protein
MHDDLYVGLLLSILLVDLTHNLEKFFAKLYGFYVSNRRNE